MMRFTAGLFLFALTPSILLLPLLATARWGERRGLREMAGRGRPLRTPRAPGAESQGGPRTDPADATPANARSASVARPTPSRTRPSPLPPPPSLLVALRCGGATCPAVFASTLRRGIDRVAVEKPHDTHAPRRPTPPPPRPPRHAAGPAPSAPRGVRAGALVREPAARPARDTPRALRAGWVACRQARRGRGRDPGQEIRPGAGRLRQPRGVH